MIQQSTSVERPVVMVSSTALDLPEHRGKVLDACWRQDMVPKMMEHLPASSADALQVSQQLVDESDIYLGIFGFRYGYIPRGHDVSITEMEYNWAIARDDMPKLIFLMADDHPVTAKDIDRGVAAERLLRLRERLADHHSINVFHNPEELRALVIDSLSRHRRVAKPKADDTDGLPLAPAALVAHRYSLSHTRGFIGRHADLKRLTDWISNPKSKEHQSPILAIVAMGGTGKTALTWKWFQDVAPQALTALAGRMWWSFYESDANFDAFLTTALAYTTGRRLSEVAKVSRKDRERQLLDVLDREPFLLVLDGLERILAGYAEHAAEPSAEEGRQATSSDASRRGSGQFGGAGSRDSRWRKTKDLRDGEFLRQLATIRQSRILISTRDFPVDLQAKSGRPRAGCDAIHLAGLEDDDAVALWKTYGVTGSHEALVRLFRTVENHPLFIQSLAGQVAYDRHANGDFDRWRTMRRDFDPYRLPLVQSKSHVLDHALRGLDDAAQSVLRTVAGFQVSVSFATLMGMLAGEATHISDEPQLDRVMAEMEDRGLLGWDREANRYTMHPIVRGSIWSRLGPAYQKEVRNTIYLQFRDLPQVNWKDVASVDELIDPMEHYCNLIELARFPEAVGVFADQLNEATLYRCCASERRAELLEMLFPDGVEQLPAISNPADQAFVINALAQSYLFAGQPGKSVPLFERHIVIQKELGQRTNLAIGLRNLSDALRHCGQLYRAEYTARSALILGRETRRRREEAESLCTLAAVWAVRGRHSDAALALDRALSIDQRLADSQGEGVDLAYLAQSRMWRPDTPDASQCADRCRTLADDGRVWRDLIRALRLQGTAALKEQQREAAEAHLQDAIRDARSAGLVEEELAALCELAELRRQESRFEETRDLLEQVWSPANAGPYPLILSRANCVAALACLDQGETMDAIDAATRAFRSAWCDGEPFAFQSALEAATAVLSELEAAVPSDIDPFDRSGVDPLPEVIIDPPDDPITEAVDA